MGAIANQESRSWIDYPGARIHDLNLAHDHEYVRSLSLIEESLQVWTDNPYLLRMEGLNLIECGRSAEAIQTLQYMKKFSQFHRIISDMEIMPSQNRSPRVSTGYMEGYW